MIFRAGTVATRISPQHATETPVKRTPRTVAALTPDVVLAAGTAACGVESTPEPDRVGVVETLPPDTGKEQSKKQAEAFGDRQDSDQGHASVHDVFGNATITRHRF